MFAVKTIAKIFIFSTKSRPRLTRFPSRFKKLRDRRTRRRVQQKREEKKIERDGETTKIL